MDDNERIKLLKAIQDIDNKINNYDRTSAIELIKKVRLEHPGKEQIAYIVSNVPLDFANDDMIINTLKAEKHRLLLKITLGGK